MIPTDPLFAQQWHLRNTGQTGGTPGMDINVTSVWDEYTGAGIRIAVNDTGVDPFHPDIAPNYDAASDRNYRTGQPDGSPDQSLEVNWHGTAVAGMIAAKINGGGAVGVAPDAVIVSLAGFGEPQAFIDAASFDIMNNSWGFSFPFTDDFLDPAFGDFVEAIDLAISSGRGGFGTVLVFAAGNAYDASGSFGLPPGSVDGFDNANFHNFQNSRFVISVAALDDNGTYASPSSELGYSTPGAPVLVSAPGTQVLTTDIAGPAGDSGGDFTTVDGTSFAAPIVSGVVALMLDAQPALGYRDVQEILTYSARFIDPIDQSWLINGTRDWNNGGLHSNVNYGFGLVDAHAAVRLAESWPYISTLANEQSVSASSGRDLDIDDLDSAIDSVTLGGGIEIDFVEVRVQLEHSHLGDLNMFLTSPSGTNSPLMVQPLSGFLEGGALDFVFSSAQFWGESSGGTWTLQVDDVELFDSGTLFGWSLTAYGDADLADDHYVFTDEYGTFAAADPSRYNLSDSGGDDTLNGAALTANAILNLLPQGTSSLGGGLINLAPGAVIEHALGGDGDDFLIGNDLVNGLYGNRGDDTIIGLAGGDTIIGGAGGDFLVGQGGADFVYGGIDGDVLYGGDQGDFLAGEAGDDFITGELGADVADGGIGNDRIHVEGDDLFAQGGEGIFDTLVPLNNAGTLTRIDLGNAVNQNVTGAGPTVLGFEVVDGTISTAPLEVHGAVLNGNGNVLFGSQLDDTITGSGATDIILGNTGNDLLSGGGAVRHRPDHRFRRCGQRRAAIPGRAGPHPAATCGCVSADRQRRHHHVCT